MQSITVILGTGGTIAGRAERADDTTGYTAGAVGIDALIAGVPPLAGLPLEHEQLAQVDSKDMGPALWQRLARRIAEQLARAEVGGVVVTHGTDTLEETAYFLQRVLAPAKPVVLTAAMRPASALSADGPRNLLDAVHVARTPGARGVVAVLAGTVFGAADLRKWHTSRLDAFGAGDAGPLALVDAGGLRRLRDWPAGQALGLEVIARDAAGWPRVEIVTSHGGADGAVIDALLAHARPRLAGLVLAGTGNGTLHADLEAAARRARAAGVLVLRASRCAAGAVVAAGGDEETLPAAGALSAVQARIELQLALLQGACSVLP
jgi:L-asparaginase